MLLDSVKSTYRTGSLGTERMTGKGRCGEGGMGMGKLREGS